MTLPFTAGQSTPKKDDIVLPIPMQQTQLHWVISCNGSGRRDPVVLAGTFWQVILVELEPSLRTIESVPEEKARRKAWIIIDIFISTKLEENDWKLSWCILFVRCLKFIQYVQSNLSRYCLSSFPIPPFSAHPARLDCTGPLHALPVFCISLLSFYIIYIHVLTGSLAPFSYPTFKAKLQCEYPSLLGFQTFNG